MKHIRSFAATFSGRGDMLALLLEMLKAYNLRFSGVIWGIIFDIV